jgi:hypothetical protein
MAKADLARTGSTIRCAIYTRKSSDEGLEQEFNSLDAQQEACEAYIVSQRSSTCRTWAPASKWKAPSEFPIHSILCLTTHPSAVAA